MTRTCEVARYIRALRTSHQPHCIIRADVRAGEIVIRGVLHERGFVLNDIASVQPHTIWNALRMLEIVALGVGEKRLFKIAFRPLRAGTTLDTILFGDGFLDQQAVVTGTASNAGVDYQSNSQAPSRLVLSDDARTAHAILPTSWSNPVSVAIQDVRGVNVLTTSLQPNASLDFDLSSLASGVYFYRLSCGNESAAGKLSIRK